MPNYIRVKQIDPGEFTGAVNTVIESQSFKINVDTATGLVLNNVGGVSISGANIDLVDSSLSISGNLNVGGTIQGNINLAVANVVYLSGNQNISGVKTFASRPTVNGTGVLLSGEVLSNKVVFTTGNQTISGNKTFANSIVFGNENGIGGSISAISDGESHLYINGGDNVSYVYLNSSQATMRLGEYGITIDSAYEYFNINNTDVIYINGEDAFISAPTAGASLKSLDINNLLNFTHTGRQVGYISGESLYDGDVSNLYIKTNGGGEQRVILQAEGHTLALGRDGGLSYGNNPFSIHGNGEDLNVNYANVNVYENINCVKSVYGANLVYKTTNQTISGIKTFASRPTVNGTGVLLSGDSASRVNYLTSTLTQTGTYYANSGYNNLYLKYNNTSTTEGITRVILPYESGSLGDILNIEWTNEGGVNGRTGDYFIINRLVSNGSPSPNIPLKKDNYISFIRTPGGDNSGYAWHQVGAHETTLSSTINYSRNIFPTKENLYVTGQTISNLFTNTISDGLGRVDILSGQSVLIYSDQANISGQKSFQNLNYVRKTTAYNYVTGNFGFNNFYVNLINATSPRTGILPTPTSGLNYYVKNLNTGVVLLTGISGLKIDTADYLNLYKNESVELLGVNNLGYTGWITMSLNEGLT